RLIYFRNPDLTPDRDFHDHTRPKEPHIHSSSTLLQSSERDSTRSGTAVAQAPRTPRKEARRGRERRGEKEERSDGRGRTGAEEAADHPTRSATRVFFFFRERVEERRENCH
ncbi:unnamed protein product, partial [Brassica rapa subsp. narinosa]